MNIYKSFSVKFLVLCACLQIVMSASPNIVIIIADDLGWNDVGFHGSDQIPTPNIDALAYNGVILNSHYVQSISTPSRAALFTGRYPMRLGLHGNSLEPGEPVSLPPGKILPQYFKELGYSTHLVGKWHLGYARWNDTPTLRGFDHHFGGFNPYSSYYDYLTTFNVNGTSYSGFDLRRDREPAWDVVGKYATDAFAEHAKNTIEKHDVSKPLLLVIAHLAVHCANEGKLLEAPQETINKFKHIPDANRRTYAAMVSKLDDSVGTVVEALQQKGLLQNSIILFMSDNGGAPTGPHHNWGSNYPLRGIKNTLFEGGIRSASFIWSPLIVQNSRVSNELIHISDWLPTFYSAAGADVTNLDPDLDGLDQWSSLVYDLPSPRTDILINFDEVTKNTALRFNNWKLIVGTMHDGKYDGYFGDSGNIAIYPVSYNMSAVSNNQVSKSIALASFTPPMFPADLPLLRDQATLRCLNPKAKRNPCDPGSGEVCLYDIPSDPCEENNLAKFFPSVVRKMKRALVEYKSGLIPQINQKPDIENADPKHFKYTWNPWIDCAEPTCSA